MKKYKVLREDMSSPFQSFKYEIGKEYTCNDFDNDETVGCSRGFYATGIEGICYSHRKNTEIYLCDVSGQSVEFDQYKQRHEKIKILKKVNKKHIKDQIKKQELIEKLGYDIEKAIFPFSPFSKKRTKVSSGEIQLLKSWNSFGTSVWDSVRDSVGDSVWDSVWDSIGNSVWDSVWDSIRDSIGAYISSIFFNIKKWKYVNHEEDNNPFQPCIDLWNHGLVPSFDGTTWRLHNGKNILYEAKEGGK